MAQGEVTSHPGEKALIALGGNAASRYGSPRETLEMALEVLDVGAVSILARSQMYQTPCFPAGAGPDYVNAVVLVETRLSPEALLELLHELEADFDRVRTTRWASRTLDLDLLLMDQKIRPDQSTLREWVNLSPLEQQEKAPGELVLPHPRLQDRAFVLVPAAELWPDWRHPLLGKTLAEMLADLPDAARREIVPIPV